MSLQHRRRAVLERVRERGNGKRASLPVEYQRSSEQPPVDFERPAASSRQAAPASSPAPAKRKKSSRRR